MSSNSCISQSQNCGSATNFPQFIDDKSCICGLVPSVQTRNGQTEQAWRCISDLSSDLEDGTTGKWFMTSLPSQELSGITRPQNWGQNPPELDQAYIAVDNKYQELGSGDAPQLIGNDKDCTGKNNTGLSEQLYRNSQNPMSSGSSSSSMPSSTSSMMSSASSMMSSASSMASSSASAASMSASSGSPSMTASSSPSSTSAAAAAESSTSASIPQVPHANLKAILVVGMLFASTLAMAI